MTEYKFRNNFIRKEIIIVINGSLSGAIKILHNHVTNPGDWILIQ